MLKELLPKVRRVAILRPNFSATCRRATEQVAKVLNGANPGDIPVEQPNVVELAINLKTAKALGVAIPPAMRLRADRVIE